MSNIARFGGALGFHYPHSLTEPPGYTTYYKMKRATGLAEVSTYTISNLQI